MKACGAGRVGGLAATDMEETRRCKLAAEAALVETELAHTRSQVVEVPIVGEVVGNAFSAVRARLLAIGATAAPRLEQIARVGAVKPNVWAIISGGKRCRR